MILLLEQLRHCPKASSLTLSLIAFAATDDNTLTVI
jgi:hypothetical protein